MRIPGFQIISSTSLTPSRHADSVQSAQDHPFARQGNPGRAGRLCQPIRPFDHAFLANSISQGLGTAATNSSSVLVRMIFTVPRCGDPELQYCAVSPPSPGMSHVYALPCELDTVIHYETMACAASHLDRRIRSALTKSIFCKRLQSLLSHM